MSRNVMHRHRPLPKISNHDAPLPLIPVEIYEETVSHGPYPEACLLDWDSWAWPVLVAPYLPTLKPERCDLSGQTVIVTGSNVGIGLKIARALADFGASVVLACRNKEKAERARQDILENSNGAISPENVEVRVLDCEDLDSVREFVDNWSGKKLDILVNNAGITAGTYRKTKQGFESTYATDVLSHYLLTLLLLPSMKNHARVVNVSSASNYMVGKQLDVDDLDKSKDIEGKLCLKDGDQMETGLTLDLYGRSKLLQVYFTREMQKRLDSSDEYREKIITVHVYHPGIVKSNIYDREGNMNISASMKSVIVKFVNSFGVSTEQGAATGVHLATSKEAETKKGMYWERMAVKGPNRLVEDEATRAKIWDRMAEECHLDNWF